MAVPINPRDFALFEVRMVTSKGLTVGLPPVDYPYTDGIYQGECEVITQTIVPTLPKFMAYPGVGNYVTGFSVIIPKIYVADPYDFTYALRLALDHLQHYIPDLKDPGIQLLPGAVATLDHEHKSNIAILQPPAGSILWL